MYMFVSSSLSEPNITNHGIQIPKVVKYTQTNILLSLTVDSDLMVNKQYSTIITGINANGESKYNVSVEFGMFYSMLLSIIIGKTHQILILLQIRMMFS